MKLLNSHCISAQKYSASCEAVLTEHLSNYGELFEIWFDGGILPPEQGGPRALEIIERLQPNAILFQEPKQAKNIIRWVGNERGASRRIRAGRQAGMSRNPTA
ncbi:MAG: hypothetical protein IJR99_03335 [Kiritimatiellae bacterium]|nr:hypothetical protein [Kiritimatiellia bacterium]